MFPSVRPSPLLSPTPALCALSFPLHLTFATAITGPCRQLRHTLLLSLDERFACLSVCAMALNKHLHGALGQTHYQHPVWGGRARFVHKIKASEATTLKGAEEKERKPEGGPRQKRGGRVFFFLCFVPSSTSLSLPHLVACHLRNRPFPNRLRTHINTHHNNGRQGEPQGVPPR